MANAVGFNEVLGYAENLATTGVNIGQKILTFVTAEGNWPCLVGLGAFILVLGVTLISSFFKN